MSGGVESTWKVHTSRLGRVSNYLVMGNVRKPTNIISVFLALRSRLRFFVFVSRTTRFCFSKKNVAVLCHFVKNGCWFLTLKTKTFHPHQLSPTKKEIILANKQNGNRNGVVGGGKTIKRHTKGSHFVNK